MKNSKSNPANSSSSGKREEYRSSSQEGSGINTPGSYSFNPESFSKDIFVAEASPPYGFFNIDLITLSRQGILKKYLLQFSKKLSFTMKELARVLHISERTLQRYHPEDALSSEASERAILLAQLYRKGIAVFETSDNFNDWLRTPLPAFEQQAPIQYLDTSFGFQLVSDELGRIEHGIFA